MKKSIKNIIIITSIIGAFSIGALAGSNSVTATLRPDIKVVVDGQSKDFKDAKGNKVNPLAYNGTTYLPVRSVGELMGKEVKWDGGNNTINIAESNTSEIKPDENTEVKNDNINTEITKLTGELINIKDIKELSDYTIGLRVKSGVTLNYKNVFVGTNYDKNSLGVTARIKINDEIIRVSLTDIPIIISEQEAYLNQTCVLQVQDFLQKYKLIDWSSLRIKSDTYIPITYDEWVSMNK